MSGKRSVSEKPKQRGILYYLGVGLSAGLLAFVVLVGTLVIVVPAATGSTPLTVLTSSMEPSLPPGTLVIVKPAEASDIRVGEVMTYQLESGKAVYVTHRVTEKSTSSNGEVTFTTKGDNNDVEDPAAVQEVQILGEVWYSVPWIGYINNMVGGNRGWLVPTIAIGLFLYAGYMLASGLATSLRKRRDAAPGVAEAPAEEANAEQPSTEPKITEESRS
ncbi:MAG: signal peptidase I [Salinibacterium sp.]|nr:signal peptidase I [Salinibacterium sp.]MBF0671097.1 signal peptidase I [Salinibacterium sp.]